MAVDDISEVRYIHGSSKSLFSIYVDVDNDLIVYVKLCGKLLMLSWAQFGDLYTDLIIEFGDV